MGVNPLWRDLVKMKIKNNTFNLKILCAALILLLILTSSMFSSARNLERISTINEFSATIWTTDVFGNPKIVFSPDEIVYIHGKGFLGNFIVDVDITKPDSSVESDTTIRNFIGQFEYEYNLNDILGVYNIYASDGTNSATRR